MKKLTAVLLGGAAAMLTLTAAQAVPIAPAAQSYAGVRQPKLQLAQYHHHFHHGFHGGPRFGFGFYGGPVYGPDYDYDYGPPVVYGAPAPAGGDDVAYCMQRYRSYDPESGTYLGYDGMRHPCP